MDSELSRRIEAGLTAVQNRIAYFGEWFSRAESNWKHDGTRVTDADIAISRELFAELSAQFPDDDYCSEESDATAGPRPLKARFAWVLDPIDGTNNYALGIPVTAISLGLLEDGVPVCGFIYDFGRRTLFHGGLGLGVFRNGERISRIEVENRESRFVAMHTPIASRYMPVVNLVIENYKLRSFGSGALHLTYTALGMIDLCLDYTVKVWDIAAAYAFCEELGTKVDFFRPSPFPLRSFDVKMQPVQYLAGSPAAVESLLEKNPEIRAAALP